MTLKYVRVILLPMLFAGCAPSHQETAPDAWQHPSERSSPGPVAPPPPSVEELSSARSWTPRFIATGFASGIMVEFTGLKANAPLHANYAGIELRKTPADSASPATQSLTATINDLRQAFFKVKPGVYALRQTRQWADQSYIQNVEVREGNYSVVTIGVLVPAAPRIESASDTHEDR